jgi:hypothetical protein
MADCWREHVPSDFEVEMARCRLKARSDHNRHTTRSSHALVFGFVLALSSMFPLMQARPPELAAPADIVEPKPPAIPEQSLAAPPPPPAIEPARSVDSRATKVARSKAVSRSARPPSRTSVRGQAAANRERALLAVAGPEVSFAHVADAGFRPDPLTRDVAALSRAYLLVSDGRAERARDMLERLADRGATAGIRRRASELLMRASEQPPSSLLFLAQRSNVLG